MTRRHIGLVVRQPAVGAQPSVAGDALDAIAVCLAVNAKRNDDVGAVARDGRLDRRRAAVDGAVINGQDRASQLDPYAAEIGDAHTAPHADDDATGEGDGSIDVASVADKVAARVARHTTPGAIAGEQHTERRR